jgi:hypothetical protein
MGFGTEDYLARFEKFVKNIRSDLQNESLPIYTFQLNRMIKPAINEELDRKYDRIREAQRQAAEKIPGVFVFPAIDGLSMSDFIHASRLSYATYAERLAAKVLFEEYGKGLGASVPTLASAILKEKELILSFDGVESYLYDFRCGTPALPIEVSDGEGIIPLVSHSVCKNEIRIELSRAPSSDAFVSLQCGTDPRYYVADFLSGIPALCYYRYPIMNQEGE